MTAKEHIPLQKMILIWETYKDIQIDVSAIISLTIVVSLIHLFYCEAVEHRKFFAIQLYLLYQRQTQP